MVTERRIAADDFFTGLYTTALAADEMIVACEIPVALATQKFSFTELARRHGDYAIVGLAVAAMVQSGTVEQIRLAWLGIGSTPVRSMQAEQILQGQALTQASIDQAVDALRKELDPIADLTHSEATKRQLSCVLLKRALQGWLLPEALAKSI